MQVNYFINCMLIFCKCVTLLASYYLHTYTLILCFSRTEYITVYQMFFLKTSESLTILYSYLFG